VLGAGVHRSSGSRAADFKSVLKAGLQNGCTIGKRLRGALIGHFLLRWTEGKDFDRWIFLLQPINDVFPRFFGPGSATWTVTLSNTLAPRSFWTDPVTLRMPSTATC